MGELTPLSISVLALLNERPMHPYEMYQLLVERHEDRIVKIRPGSLYHTVERLADAALIRVTGTERAGNRPERTTYAITDAGGYALTARVAELIRNPVNEYPAFALALSESHNIDRVDIVEHLNARIDQLQLLVDEFDSLIAIARNDEVPEAYWIAADYLRVLHSTERDWLRRLADRIESKDLPWPRP